MAAMAAAGRLRAAWPAPALDAEAGLFDEEEGRDFLGAGSSDGSPSSGALRRLAAGLMKKNKLGATLST